jgi:hypothetical protein
VTAVAASTFRPVAVLRGGTPTGLRVLPEAVTRLADGRASAEPV